jgi:hypothetical protein
MAELRPMRKPDPFNLVLILAAAAFLLWLLA